VVATRESHPAFFIHQLTREERDVASSMLSSNANTAQNSSVKTPKEYVSQLLVTEKFFENGLMP